MQGSQEAQASTNLCGCYAHTQNYHNDTTDEKKTNKNIEKIQTEESYISVRKEKAS